MSSASSVIQFSEQHESTSGLQFQNFSRDDVATLKPSESYTSYVDGPDTYEGETADLLTEEKRAPSFWEFSYYQQFFDVDSDQVIQRILWSMVPLPGRATYLDRQIRPNPDLYGPFWISTTLSFTTAISANIAEYFMSEGQKNRVWHYDFHKVTLASTAIYSYAFLIPIAIWSLLWYRRRTDRMSLLEILCIYGYSLSIYIPVSIFWVVQISWLQWILVVVGATLSGSVFLHTFWPVVKDEDKKIATVVLCCIFAFHVLLAVGFMTYFFQPISYDPVKSTLDVSTIVDAKDISTATFTSHAAQAEVIRAHPVNATVVLNVKEAITLNSSAV